MLSYGRHIVAVNVLAAVLHHADLLIVGRMLGAAALGFYQMAYKVPEMTIIMLVRAASTVLFISSGRSSRNECLPTNRFKQMDGVR